MPMIGTRWTIICDAYDCSCGSPWSSKSKPLTVTGDREEAITKAEKAGWRRCWSRDPKTLERKLLRSRRDPGWWCPWHVQQVLDGEARRDRLDAELAAAVVRAPAEAVS